jgi:UDP:flavonoid glycosyltransferase YjiC (YdhE family)
VLVVSNAGHGHLFPLIPIVRRLIAAGHEAVIAVPSEFVATVQGLGLPARGIAAQSRSEAEREQQRRYLEQLPQPQRSAEGIGAFVASGEAGLAELDALCAELAPNVILREQMAHGGWLLGERRQLPVVVFDSLPLPGEAWATLAGGRFEEARAKAGLALESSARSLAGALTLLSGPRAWFDYVAPNAMLFRPSDAIAPPEAAPAWLSALPEPLVYATLGAALGREPARWRALLAGLARVDASVVATIGPELELTSLGAIPPNVRALRFVPQQFVLERCDAALSHGGYGSLMGALARGVPQVALPSGAADEAQNAARLVRLGAGIALAPDERAPEHIAAALRRVLREPGPRWAAQRVAREIEALPPIDEVVGWIEAMAAP